MSDRDVAPFNELARDIASGRISPVTLVESMLERIARHDGALHSYATVAGDAALIAATEAAREIAAGRWRGPLHGIPIAVKDAFFTRDMRTGLGSSIYADWDVPYESTATQRLRRAGAIVIGKLTLTEGVYAEHHPSVTAPVNPFGSGHWTGTSSSGSGVAVTAGLCYGTLATDTGGSIRLPSACCGVVGIKPTWGRVSRHGVFPLASSLDHVGTMARTTVDAAALLAAIAGPDPADPTAARDVPAFDPVDIEHGVAGLRLGIDWPFVRARATDDIVASVEAVVAVMASLGAEIVDVTLPSTEAILTGWAVQCAVEAALAHRATFPVRRADYGGRLAALLDRGAAARGVDLAEALANRRDFSGRMAAAFEPIDLLVVPALPVAGPSLTYMAALGEDPQAIVAIGPFTAPFNVCGYPTLTTPCGASRDGIPIGVQFVAKPFAETVMCRAGHAYAEATDWHRRRPVLENAA
jgi:amidase